MFQSLTTLSDIIHINESEQQMPGMCRTFNNCFASFSLPSWLAGEGRRESTLCFRYYELLFLLRFSRIFEAKLSHMLYALRKISRGVKWLFLF